MAVKSTTDKQLSFIQEQTKFTDLPSAVTLLILRLLKGNEVASLAKVSKYFWTISKEENLWKVLYQKDFPKRVWRSNVLPSVQYASSYQAEQRWKKGLYTYQRILTDCEYSNVLEVTDHQLICTGTDKNSNFANQGDCIQIWDLSSATLLYSLKELCGYDGPFKAVDDPDYLICYATCGLGASIAVWNKSTGVFLWKKDCLYKQILEDNRLLIVNSEALSRDYTINILNKNDGSLILKVEAGNIELSTIHLDKDYIIACTQQGVVKFWDKYTGELKRYFSISGEEDFSCFYLQEDQIVCGYKNGKIKIWDKQDGTVCQVFEFHEDEYVQKLLIDEKTIIACYQKTVVGWDRKNAIPFFTIKTESRFNTMSLSSLDENTFSLFDEKSYIEKFELRNKSTGSLLYSVKGPERWLTADGKRIFVLPDKTLRIYDQLNGQLLFTIENVYSYKVQGDRLFLAYDNGTLDICNFSPIQPFPNQGQLKLFQSLK